MCGRFVQRYTWDDIQDLYDLPGGPAPNLPAHYNIAPTDPVEVVRSTAEGTRELVSMPIPIPAVIVSRRYGAFLGLFEFAFFGACCHTPCAQRSI